jgi:PAS domain S-box-containing protein
VRQATTETGKQAREGEGREIMASERILVVEDESVVALDVGLKLEDMGYRVCGRVQSGEEAILEVERTHPDLVLMDVKLKGTMDGIQAVEQIRARFDTPVVYLTAYADKLTLARARETGPLGYVLKPFEIAELRAAIEIALHRHRLERRVRESERWLAATLRSIGDGVIATDGQGCVEFMNPVAEGLTGCKSQEASGRPLSEVLTIVADESDALPNGPSASAPAGEIPPGAGQDAVLIGDGGQQTYIEKSVAPIRDAGADVAGAVVVFRDVTQRKRMEEALREHSVELEARNRELEAFARTVAHELKDPLGRVIGFAHLLARESDRMTREEALRLLGFIEQSAYGMGKIIDQLLLLAEAREKDVPVEPLDPTRVVAQARKRLAGMISRNRAEIVQPDAWPQVLGYAPWVEAVFVNYLSNAIKYGGRPPCVRLGATVRADRRVRLWVQDNGRGIPEEAQARLFTPFTQLDPSSSQGLGLGLSIVRLIAEKLDGEVEVESEMGQGSTFSFILPGADTMASSLSGQAGLQKPYPA